MKRVNKAVMFLTIAALLAGMLPTTAFAATAAQNSALSANTFPSTMMVGSTLVVTVTIKNIGTDTWTSAKGYTLKAVGGSDPFTSVVSYALNKTDAIKTNQTKIFTISLKAPASAGIYKTDWRMYKGTVAFGATFTKNVSVISLKSIAVTTPAKKLTYFVGDKLDLSGLVVTGTYSDGSKKVLAVAAANVTGFNSSAAAAGQTLTITVGGMKTTYKINVLAVVLSSIAITTPAKKLTYYVGDPLDLTGLVVTGTYNNGSKKVLTISTANVTGFNSSKAAADQTLTIAVSGIKTSYQIDVLAVTLTSIAITSPAKKLTYYTGDPLDLTGLAVTGTYNNGSKKVLTISVANVTGFNSSKAATGQTLTITVSGIKTSYQINVLALVLNSIDITTPADKLTYDVGEDLDLSGLVVTGTYNNGSKKALAVTPSDVTGFDSSQPAAGQTLTIKISDQTATFTIDVVAVPVSSVSIDGKDAVVSGLTLQLGVSIEPENATDKGIEWSIVSGPGDISDTGLLTATGIGTIEVQAVAKDGSLASDTLDITSFHPIYNLAGEPQSIDPTFCADFGEAAVINAVFEGLTKITNGMVPGPGIADSWDISPDGKTYTFHIRDGAKWSDGQPVTAGDFYYAWSRMLDPQLSAPYAYLLTPCIKNADEYTQGQCELSDVGIEAVDDQTFKVTLLSSTPYFLQLCAMPAFAPEREDIVSQNSDGWTTDPQTYVGDGPFKLAAWDHGLFMELVKNDQYWNKDSVSLDDMYWSIIPDDTDYMAAWNAGAVDVIESPPASDIPQLNSDGKLTVEPNLGTYYLQLNTSKAPFTNADFRKALALAIDRDTLVNTTLQGGQLPADALVPPGIKADASTDFYTKGQYFPSAGDKDEAQSYMDKSGLVADDITIDYLYNGSNGTNAAIAQAIKSRWEQILGIHVNLVTESWGALCNDVTLGNYDVARAGWIADYADPMTFLDSYTTGNPNNVVGYSDQNYDGLIDSAKSETDPATRMQDLHQAEALLMDAMPVIPIYYYTNTMCINPEVTGVYKTPTGMIYFDEAALSQN